MDNFSSTLMKSDAAKILFNTASGVVVLLSLQIFIP